MLSLTRRVNPAASSTEKESLAGEARAEKPSRALSSEGVSTTIISPTEPIKWRQEGSERLLENRITEPANNKPAVIAIPNNIKACKVIVVL